ncbi:uncharacterized protein [Montipora foliosa]|uniref:uncharacterized protein n=1 Tax=Montipora foliosa TaxID=591990 RepID=UPI0035F1A362
MVAQKYHTPFCERNCKIEHHDLITVLCLDSSQKSDELPDLLRECINSYQNWDPNGEVPDPLDELRCPLIYLASAFGKAGLVRALLRDNFDARALNANGETALHAAVQYIYRTGTLKSRGLKVASTLGPIKNRMKAFEQILAALTESDPNIMFVQDNDGNTVFHAAAENIWNDRQNDRLGKSACFFQVCLRSMLTRLSELEEAKKVSKEEIIQTLNAENNDGDTIFHVLARDYAYGFKSLKYAINKFFPGQVPSKVNKENETVAKIALERNRTRALKVFPEFREHDQISISSDSATSESDLPSPSTSKYSEGSASIAQSTAQRQIPIIVISDYDMPGVPHSIVEEGNSSSEVLGSSQENVSGSSELNTDPLKMAKAGSHDLMTASDDRTLANASQMRAKAFLPDDNLGNAPTEAEVMCVADTVLCNERVIEDTSESTVPSIPGTSLSHDQSDLLAPFSITFSSNDSNAIPIARDRASPTEVPPSEERICDEQSACREQDRGQEITDSVVEAADDSNETLEGVILDTEASFNMETLNKVLVAAANRSTESDSTEISHDCVFSSDLLNSETPPNPSQVNRTQCEKGNHSSLRSKSSLGSVPSELFDPPRKQLRGTGDYLQLYTCHAPDTPNIALQYQPNSVNDHTNQTLSSTSLASASTETINSEASNRLDLGTEGLQEKSTILKCITDNTFLEFLITEGLELDSCSKKGVVDVVMSQYNNKLSSVENSIPKLAAQIKHTETTVGQQKEKVKHLQNELEFVKGDIVKNERLLLKLKNEQQGLSKQRKVLKRKVVRCEDTMKNLLVKAKKSRFD